MREQPRNEAATEAERTQPRDTPGSNGWVVAALQAAWSAIHHADAAGEGLVESLERAVRCGNDTDTVAAIAGALAGARWGGSAVPALWRRELHGWPGLHAGARATLAPRSAPLRSAPLRPRRAPAG